MLERFDLLTKFLGCDLWVSHRPLQGCCCCFGFDLKVLRKQLCVGFQSNTTIIDQGVGLIFEFDELSALDVLIGIKFGFLPHPLNFRFAQSPGIRNLDALFFSGSLIFSSNFENAVGINFKGNFDLRYAARGCGNAFEQELAETFIVFNQCSLALECVNFHTCLPIGRRAVHLRSAGGDSCIALDYFCEHPAQGFESQGEWRHVQQ